MTNHACQTKTTTMTFIAKEVVITMERCNSGKKHFQNISLNNCKKKKKHVVSARSGLSKDVLDWLASSIWIKTGHFVFLSEVFEYLLGLTQQKIF